MRSIVSIACLTALCLCGPLLEAGEQNTQMAARRSSRAPWIGLAVGAGAGFGAGSMVGFGYFDEAINSTQKVITSMVVGTIAGAVCGYFIGRGIAGHDEHLSESMRGPVFEPAMAGRFQDRASDEIMLELSSKIRPGNQLPRLSYGDIYAFPQESSLPSMP